MPSVTIEYLGEDGHEYHSIFEANEVRPFCGNSY